LALLALLVAGWFWLLAGGAVLVCACEEELGCWADCACEGAVVVLLSDRDGWDGWFDCACVRVVSLPPVALGWPVVVPSRLPGEVDWAFVDGAGLADGVEAEDDGADCDADEFGLVWVCAAGGRFDFSLGDCAHAPVPSIRPMAVVINKGCFMCSSSRWFLTMVWGWVYAQTRKTTRCGFALFQIDAGRFRLCSFSRSELGALRRAVAAAKTGIREQMATAALLTGRAAFRPRRTS
jgi:hypothetical protein